MERLCLGENKFITPASYKWFVPNGKKASEITYCQWCYGNGCFNKEDVYQMEAKRSYANCDCPKNHKTLSEKLNKTDNMLKDDRTIECPKCYFHRIMSMGMGFCTGAISSCKFCGGYIHSSSYSVCYNCCAIQNMCFSCNQIIKPGDEYFNDFWENFQPDNLSCYVDDSNGRLLFVLYRLRGKTPDQIMDEIINGELYKEPESKEQKFTKYSTEISRSFHKYLNNNNTEKDDPKTESKDNSLKEVDKDSEEKLDSDDDSIKDSMDSSEQDSNSDDSEPEHFFDKLLYYLNGKV